MRMMLAAAQEWEARSLFEWLGERYPDHYQEGQLQTLQRGCGSGGHLNGLPKEVFFPQAHMLGRIMQTVFTS